MFASKLRSKRVWVPTLASVLAIGVAGTVWASSASADLGGSERDRVVAAAQKAVGGGKVLSAEGTDHDTGDRDAEERNVAYQVEILQAGGSEVDVKLDKDLNVISQEGDDDSGRDDADQPGAADDRDADDRAVSASERSSAGKAATAAVGGGTVADVEGSDDRGVAYEVEVHGAGGTDWDVELDASFGVVKKSVDD
jgi:uncharacterized membrane protein YkoI